MLNKGFITALFAIGAIIFSFGAMADSVDRKLSKMQGDIDTLYRAVFADGGAPKNLTTSASDAVSPSQTSARIQDIELQLRQITGQLERQSHDIEALRAQISNSNAPKSAPSFGSVVTPIAAPSSNPDIAYDAAFSLIKNGQYEQAEKAFSDFLLKWPNHKLAPNAQYWRSETLYVRGKYEAALRGFAQGYRKWPASVKAPDNLLKMGMSLDKIGQRRQACTAISKLLSDYPSGAAGVIRRAKAEEKRMNCK